MRIPHVKIDLRRPGFTMIEILVVIVIIVVLMALVIGSLQYVRKSQAEKQTAVMGKAVETGLERYKVDNGYFPDGNGNETSSNAVYMALFNDWNNDGKTDKKASDVYLPELNPLTTGANKWAELHGDKYLIIDAFGAPFRYRLGFQEKDSKGKEGPGKNARFDFWSIGADGATDLKNNKKTGVNKDDIGNT